MLTVSFSSLGAFQSESSPILLCPTWVKHLKRRTNLNIAPICDLETLSLGHGSCKGELRFQLPMPSIDAQRDIETDRQTDRQLGYTGELINTCNFYRIVTYRVERNVSSDCAPFPKGSKNTMRFFFLRIYWKLKTTEVVLFLWILHKWALY